VQYGGEVGHSVRTLSAGDLCPVSKDPPLSNSSRRIYLLSLRRLLREPRRSRHDSVSALKQAEAYPTVSIEILCD
jgi:hypothetical protein